MFPKGGQVKVYGLYIGPGRVGIWAESEEKLDAFCKKVNRYLVSLTDTLGFYSKLSNILADINI